MSVELTPAQLRVVRLWHDFTVENGRPPKVREAMALLGAKSVNAVMCHVRLLQAKGVMEHTGEAYSYACWRLAGLEVRAAYREGQAGEDLKSLLGIGEGAEV